MTFPLAVYAMAFSLDPGAREARLQVGRPGSGRGEIALRPVMLGEVASAVRECDGARLGRDEKVWAR